MKLIERLKKLIFKNSAKVRSTDLVIENYDFEKPYIIEEKQLVQKYYEELHEEVLQLNKKETIINENLTDIQREYENKIEQRLKVVRKLIQSRESKFDYFSWKIEDDHDENSVIKTALEVRLEAEYFNKYKEELEKMLRDIELKSFALNKLEKNLPRINGFWRWSTSNEIVNDIRRRKTSEGIMRMNVKWSEVKAIRDVFDMYVNRLMLLEKSIDEYILNNPDSQEIINEVLSDELKELSEYKSILHKTMGIKEKSETVSISTVEELMYKYVEDTDYINSKFMSEDFTKNFLDECEKYLKESKDKLDVIYYDVPMWVKRLRKDRNEDLIKELEPEIRKYKCIIENIAGIRRTLLYVKNQGIAEIPDDLIQKVFYMSAYVDEIEQEMNPNGDEYIECFFDKDPEEFREKEELFYLSYIDELKMKIEKEHLGKEDEKAIRQALSIFANESGDKSIFAGEDRWKITVLMLLRKAGSEGLDYFFENYRMMLPKDNEKWLLDEDDSKLTNGRRITLRDFFMSYCRYEKNTNMYMKLRNRARKNAGDKVEFQSILNLYFKLNKEYAKLNEKNNSKIANGEYGGKILYEFFQKSPKDFEESFNEEMEIYHNNPDYLEIPPEDNRVKINYNYEIGFFRHDICEISSIGDYTDGEYIDISAANGDKIYDLSGDIKRVVKQHIVPYGNKKSNDYTQPNTPYYWNHANKLEIKIETELNRRVRIKGEKTLPTTVNIICNKGRHSVTIEKNISELIAKFAITIEKASNGKISAKNISREILDNCDTILAKFKTDKRYNEGKIMREFSELILGKCCDIEKYAPNTIFQIARRIGTKNFFCMLAKERFIGFFSECMHIEGRM